MPDLMSIMKTIQEIIMKHLHKEGFRLEMKNISEQFVSEIDTSTDETDDSVASNVKSIGWNILSGPIPRCNGS